MPFYSATENMAALLRSARLLKFSPSGLLQITGTKRNGPPLSRLYSGPVAGRRTAVCTRHISPASGNASSRAWPYVVGCVRNYTVAPVRKDEGSGVVRAKQAQQFDWALTKLDSSVRRTGRITKTLLLRIFHDICRTGYPSGNQALLLLRSCGSLMPEVPYEERNELAHRVWEKLQEMGVQYDVSHYNALLKVYFQNEFKFSPTDFLAKMEAANVEPNRVTYQRLIAAYCQNGDIEGASTILGFMKRNDLPITETVFNSLVTGHARAGDIESAVNILSVMGGAGIEPGPDTYLALLNTYAEKGDLDNLKKTLEAADSTDCSLMDRDIMQVIFTLAKAGQQQFVPEMVKRLRHDRGYVPDAINLCLSLITQGHEDTAFEILKTFPELPSDNSNTESPTLGSFFLRHCVNMEKSLEKIDRYCRELKELNMHSSALSFSLFCALEAKKTGMSLGLMKIMKEQGLPIKPHYFWPLLTQHLKDGNTADVVELVMGMKQLNVCPDAETLSTYVFPIFPSSEAARQTLKDAGVSVDHPDFLSSEIRSVATSDLTKLYTMLSDPSYPSVDLISFRSSLVLGFKKSSDVETMVKITELLYRDERFSQRNSKHAEETTGFVLYGLIDSMSKEELQKQEDKLREYFSQLHARNVTISMSIYRGIKNLLDSCHIPELIKDVFALVGHRVSSDSVSAFPHASGSRGLALEEKLAELKAANKPFSNVLKQTIIAYCAEENLQRALELKQQHENEMAFGGYATLINTCCRHGNVEEALNLKREMSRKDSSVTLDGTKYIALVRACSINGKVEEAVEILKEMKEKEVLLSQTHVTMLFHMLKAVVAKGDVSTIRHLQDTIFTLGLAKPTTNLCSPLVTAYLERKDLSGALEATMECQKSYGTLPCIHNIIVALVEKGDTELLQKAMDFVSQKQGEMTMLYDLFFAFLQTGRYREARKIIETPGLRARPGRLQWYAEKCISLKQTEALEQMVEVTAKLFECDRDEMYNSILRLYKVTNDWVKAEAVWTKMQEENIIPRERTLRTLADILKSNGQEVPFEEPESWYQQDATTTQADTATTVPAAENWTVGSHNYLFGLCKNGKAKDAYRTLMEADQKGTKFGSSLYDILIRALLAQGLIEEAMAVKGVGESHVPDFHLSELATNLLIITNSKRGQTKDALQNLRDMLQADHVPSRLSVSRLVQAMSSGGDVAGIDEVESLTKGLGMQLSNMLFVNNKAIAHITNGDIDSAVEQLEAFFTCPDGNNSSMSYVFRKVLELDNDKALDKLSAMAERLANHFACYKPASDLFLQLLDMDRVEDAKFMLARCNALAEQKEALTSYLTQKAKSPGQVGKIKTLLSLIPDFVDKEVQNAYLMKCHVIDEDLASATALHEQMQKEGIVVDELSLKRLAGLYRKAGETVPFPEPPESFRFYADKLKEKFANTEATADT